MTLIVDGPEGLTANWLSAALGHDVRDVRVEAIGTGQTGATYRLTLDAADLPPTLIAKTAAGDSRARHRVRDGYRREVGFYADLVSTVDVNAPRCWYHAVADDGYNFTLLLDDLAPRVPGVQAKGCSIAQAEDAVRNLAALHAPRWNDETLYDLPFVRRPSDEGAAMLAGIVASATDPFVDRYEDELDPIDAATLREAATHMEEWQKTRPSPFAVVHGDYRLDNLLFHPDGGDVVAVDWQTLVVGAPTWDLAYFVGNSLRTPDRREAESDLVALYHAELRARGVQGYDLARCFDDYRIGQLQGPMITTIGCAYAAAPRTPESDAMFLAMARRSCAAMRDLGTLDAFS